MQLEQPVNMPAATISRAGLDWSIMGPLFTGAFILFILFSQSVTVTERQGFKKVRRIDGDRFVTQSIVKTKAQAEAIAEAQRAKGKRARVEQRAKAWLVLVSE